jgi:hypothetical protein
MAGPEYLVFNKAVYKDIDGVAYADGVGIGTTVALSSLHVGTTDGVILPRGTEGQRPIAPEIGLIRYNTSLSQFEGFTDNGWGGIGGGAVSVDRLTYISASNDSNLRFYTGGTLQAVLNPYGNLGVGTSNPEYRLDVRGEAYIESFRASNFTVLNDFTYVADGNSVRMSYQVNPTRYTAKLTAPTSSFDITVEGLYAVYTSNIEIYVNGTKLGYVSPAVGDYTSTYTTVGNSNTLAQISLKSAIPAENNVDIVIYPSYLEGLGSLKPGYVQQNYTLTYWTKYDTTENIYYNLGNVGIGTTYAIEQVHVEGDMWVRHMYASNFTVGNEFTYLPDGDTVRMTYQIAPTRYSEIIYEAAGKSNFDITVQGLYKVRQEDVDFFINGTRIGYLNSNINDYSLVYVGSNDNKQTLVNLTTAFMVPQSNAVSITVYPTYLDDYGQKAPGYVVQNYNLTYWSRYSDTSNIFYNNGNIGIGTTAAKELLHVEGDMFVQNIQASNVDVLANFYLAGDSDARRRYYQLQPTRVTEKISDLAGKSNFEVVLGGLYKVDGSNTEVNVNGSKLAFITSNVADYTVSSVISTSNTVVTISTAELIAYDNIVDIAVYPQYLDAQLATYPGYMVLNLNSLYWERNTVEVGGSNQTTMYYNDGNIGIGTTFARGKLEVAGNIVPSACNVYDLGSSNLRFRDLYLSGGTIDLEGVRIGTGGSNNTLEFTVGGKKQLVLGSSGNGLAVTNGLVNTVSQGAGVYPLGGWVTRGVGVADNNWLSLVWAGELGLFVAVGTSGTGNRVMTSSDGINWITRVNGVPDNNWGYITWASPLGLLVATASSGTGNRIITSPDGINWTTRFNRVDNDWRGIIWSSELNLLVTVANSGTGNRVLTSLDGITWTTRRSAADNGWLAISWAPELSLFVAVALTGTGNRVMTSPNGIDWTTRSSAKDSNWLSVTWASSLRLFAAVTGNDIMTSSNGITWTTQASPINVEWRSITWVNELGMFLATAVTGTGNRFMYSFDGINWKSRGYTVDNEWRALAWAGGSLNRLVAVAASGTGNRVMTADKVVGLQVWRESGGWVLGRSAADNQWIGLVWARELGLLVAVARTGGTTCVMTSADGINWTTRAAARANSYESITWAPQLGLLVAVSSNGSGALGNVDRVMTSTDGITWVSRTASPSTGWYSITWAAELGLLVAVGDLGTGNRVMTSANGINWTTRRSAADLRWRSVTWAPEIRLLVATAESGTGNRVMTSPDGINWTTRLSAANLSWFNVIWTKELSLFVAVSGDGGTGNRVMTSADGINWTTRLSAADAAWHSTVWIPELGLLTTVSFGGSSGARVMTSTDGINWSLRPTPADNGWVSIVWAKELGMLVSVAYEGTTGTRVMYQRYQALDANAIVSSGSNTDVVISNTGLNGISVVGDFAVDGGIGRWKAFPRDNGGVITYRYTSVLGKDGRIYHAGENIYGVVGNYSSGYGIVSISVVMAAIPMEETVTMFACADAGKIALTTSNKLYAWGLGNSYGLLGLGTTTSVYVPTLINTVSDTIIDIQIAAIDRELAVNNKCAGYLTNTGRLFIWGVNDAGQAGNGNTSAILSPLEVPQISTQQWGGFQLGNYNTYAWTSVATGGKLYACGYNTYGALGIGSASTIITTMNACIRSSDNAQIVDVKKVRNNNNFISTTTIFTVVLTNGGDLYTCGYNAQGQLGNGNTTNQNKFQGPILTGVKDFAINESGSQNGVCAIKFDGTVWVWGQNGEGCFGVGSIIAVNGSCTTPFQVPGITDAYALYGPQLPNFGTMFLQRTDKSWWFAGYAYYGLGLQNGITYSVWTKVLVPEEIVQICTFRRWLVNIDGNENTTLMLGKSGRLWGCGYNAGGDLGNLTQYGSITSYLVPAYTAFSG